MSNGQAKDGGDFIQALLRTKFNGTRHKSSISSMPAMKDVATEPRVLATLPREQLSLGMTVETTRI
jgi:hypothetical protein